MRLAPKRFDTMSDGGAKGGRAGILAVHSGRAQWMEATGSGPVFGVDSQSNAVISLFFSLSANLSYMQCGAVFCPALLAACYWLVCPYQDRI